MNLFHRIEKLKESLKLNAHRWRLTHKVVSIDVSYRAYLGLQLERTLSKRRVALPVRAVELMEHVKRHVDICGRDVLCVGCRDILEINFFRREGAARTVGIDLYSESSDICIMDMHNIVFADESFDLVYSSHSLEHALDVRKVVEELIRVVRDEGVIVIEVPANYETRGADIVDFVTLDNLHEHFSSHLSQIIWSETIVNEGGDTTALRTIMKISKKEPIVSSVSKCR